MGVHFWVRTDQLFRANRSRWASCGPVRKKLEVNSIPDYKAILVSKVRSHLGASQPESLTYSAKEEEASRHWGCSQARTTALTHLQESSAQLRPEKEKTRK